MHFQSDKKKQTQNEAHAHSAFSYSRAITRDRGTEKPFNRAGPGVGHDIDCSLDFYADLSFVKNLLYNFL